MEDSRVFEPLAIQSHQGIYNVYFNVENLELNLSPEIIAESHFIIDAKIAEIYAEKLSFILQSSLPASVLLIEATEKNKSLAAFPDYIEHLVKHKIRKNHRLIAIGGGIIQDITCFIAATILRGMKWWFYPTTLLAQADSCIGSKSSVNCNDIKNILGTFTPPEKIFIHSEWLKTLSAIDFCSGIGEILKVHVIDGLSSFHLIANDYEKLFTDDLILLHYIYRALVIKKYFIEQDEFDTNVRKIMNYGHTFGHAIESATNYNIPHGIAVTIGMDMANYVASQFKLVNHDFFAHTHPIFKKNYANFHTHEISAPAFFQAIASDKKNQGKNQLGLILANQQQQLALVFLENDHLFQTVCLNYLNYGRNL